LASAAIPCTKACTEEGRSMPRRPRTTTPPLADSNELDVFLNGSINARLLYYIVTERRALLRGGGHENGASMKQH
jgi:hypothetical protein